MATTTATVQLGGGMSCQVTYDTVTFALSQIRFGAATALSNYTATVIDVDGTVLASGTNVTATVPLIVGPNVNTAKVTNHPLIQDFFPRSTFQRQFGTTAATRIITLRLG